MRHEALFSPPSLFSRIQKKLEFEISVPLAVFLLKEPFHTKMGMMKIVLIGKRVGRLEEWYDLYICILIKTKAWVTAKQQNNKEKRPGVSGM